MLQHRAAPCAELINLIRPVRAKGIFHYAPYRAKTLVDDILTGRRAPRMLGLIEKGAAAKRRKQLALRFNART